MAKKKYYESGNMFLKIEEPLKKHNDLYIESLSKNRFTVKLSLGIDLSEKMFKLKKDSVNGKNILMLHMDKCSFVQSSSIFFRENKEDIISSLRIARQYAKDNKMSIYLFNEKQNIPLEEYSNCAFDKETNTVYPILYEELKELSKHNIPITFQPRGDIKELTFSFPEELKADIDLSYNTNIIDISLQDKNNNVSYNMSNIRFTGNEKEKLIIWNQYISRIESSDRIKNSGESLMNIISLPEHNNEIEYDYQLCSTKPVIFKTTNLEERNVNITTKSTETPFYKLNNILKKFYNNSKELSENDKKNLRKVFNFMKQNNCDIIEQSKFLLTKIKYEKFLLTKRMYGDVSSEESPYILSGDSEVFNDRDKINKDIERLIGNEIDYEMT